MNNKSVLRKKRCQSFYRHDWHCCFFHVIQ